MTRRTFLVALAATLISIVNINAQDRATELFDAEQWRAAQYELLKMRGAVVGQTELMRIDYMLAQCAARLGEPGALAMIENFARLYPESIYTDDLRLTLAVALFDEGRHEEALQEFRATNAFGLRGERRNEYHFKRGYAEFTTGDMLSALTSLRQVGGERYLPHAWYYIAYIDYAAGNHAAARRGFAALADDPSYSAVVPFYLLQLEFLDGNYDYVTTHGDALLRRSEGAARTAEIARTMAESWFRKEDYARTMHYIDLFRTNGGQMGREEYYIAGYSDFMMGRFAQAADALARVVGTPDRLSQNAAYHLAAAYLRLDRKREAMQSFSISADSDFDAAIREDALFNYGKLQFELGGGVFNEAINVLRRYIDEYPQSPRLAEATEYLAAAYYNSRNFEAAYEAIMSIPNPDNNIRAAAQRIAYFRAMDLYTAGEADRAFAILEESARSRGNPRYTALAQFWMGEIRYGQGDYAAAARLYRDYINLAPSTEPEYRMALYGLGYSHFNRAEWRAARDWFDRFIAAHTTRDSYRADAFNRLGDIDFANREFWRAIEMYDNAARIGADERFYSQFQRAMMLGHVGRPERKIESMNEIIRARQGDYVPDAMYELGLAYISLERFRDAAGAMHRFIEAYPTNEHHAAALADLGLIYLNLGDRARASEYYKMAVDRAPNSPEARNAMLALRNLYVESNDVDSYFAFAARAGMETDLSAVSRDSLAFAAAQNTYLQQGNTSGGITALRNYLDRHPRGVYRAEALFHLGEAYAATGRTDDAITSYRELGEMHFNAYTVRAFERLAPLLERAGRHSEAAVAYRRLADAAVNPTTVSRALSSYLASTAVAGSDDLIERSADDILGLSGVSEDVRREARFMKAGVLERRGSVQDAQAIYRDLATESRTAVGARSTLKVIESRMAAGDMDGAQTMILAFAEQNTPHQYELGRAFLILGDIYIARGDTFQARATLQSIIDGYSPANDGIIDAARQRIARL
ncbi:MAG: tetratricopeptide repeat protein [Rikenellaceae bacterium]|nr:tetratricopeptide repeat protein [Rikenellaceae bacterium]MCL2691855.1 tetratricopeptide repeat protein [Rikenellaceae bacterium]